jgi:hypothetical protein
LTRNWWPVICWKWNQRRDDGKIARDWYAKLHHHLGLLSREVEGVELRVYHFVKGILGLVTRLLSSFIVIVHRRCSSTSSSLLPFNLVRKKEENLPSALVPGIRVGCGVWALGYLGLPRDK